MVRFETVILRFDQQAEKTGWFYIDIPAALAEQIKPATRKAFRVKGKLDKYSFEGVSLIPMGGGNFIMAINADMRKAIGKGKGAMVKVQIEEDKNYKVVPPPELMECLADEPEALAYFNGLAPSHRAYYIKWIESAKTPETKTKRMAQAVLAFSRQLSYGQMIRSLKQDRNQLLG